MRLVSTLSLIHMVCKGRGRNCNWVDDFLILYMYIVWSSHSFVQLQPQEVIILTIPQHEGCFKLIPEVQCFLHRKHMIQKHTQPK